MMDEKNEFRKETPKGWPIKQVSQEDIPYWLKCLIVLIVVILLVFLVPALLTGILYLSSDILTAYFRGTDSKEIRSSILLLSAALGAIGIPLFIWRTLIAAQQSNIARDRSYTELFTKAVEQLGAEKPAKRVVDGIHSDPAIVDDFVPNIEVLMGAMFALERVMHDSDKDAPAIVDTLAAYIRENAGKYTHRIGIFKTVEQNDVRAAIRIIAKRPTQRVHVANATDLLSADFRNANLFRSTFNRCDIRLRRFQKSFLYQTKFVDCSLRLAKLTGAQTEHCKFLNCDLGHATIDSKTFLKAEFQGCSFQQVDLTKFSENDYANLEGKLIKNFGHKKSTKLPPGIAAPDHWSETDMYKDESRKQYVREWEAFKKKMDVE